MSADESREKCPCIHYEAEDEEDDGCCVCGHAIEEHAPTKRYPGDRSCKAVWTNAD